MFYNSLGHERQSVVRLYVNTPYLEVQDPSGKAVPTQVDPYWLNNEEMADDIFKVGKAVNKERDIELETWEGCTAIAMDSMLEKAEVST